MGYRDMREEGDETVRYVPGKKPASMVPSKALHKAISPQCCTKPIPTKIAPKLMPRKESQFAGPALGRTRFFNFVNLAVLHRGGGDKLTLGISKMLIRYH